MFVFAKLDFLLNVYFVPLQTVPQYPAITILCSSIGNWPKQRKTMMVAVVVVTLTSCVSKSASWLGRTASQRAADATTTPTTVRLRVVQRSDPIRHNSNSNSNSSNTHSSRTVAGLIMRIMTNLWGHVTMVSVVAKHSITAGISDYF